MVSYDMKWDIFCTERGIHRGVEGVYEMFPTIRYYTQTNTFASNLFDLARYEPASVYN